MQGIIYILIHEIVCTCLLIASQLCSEVYLLKLALSWVHNGQGLVHQLRDRKMYD